MCTLLYMHIYYYIYPHLYPDLATLTIRDANMCVCARTRIVHIRSYLTSLYVHVILTNKSCPYDNTHYLSGSFAVCGVVGWNMSRRTVTYRSISIAYRLTVPYHSVLYRTMRNVPYGSVSYCRILCRCIL